MAVPFSHLSSLQWLFCKCKPARVTPVSKPSLISHRLRQSSYTSCLVFPIFPSLYSRHAGFSGVLKTFPALSRPNTFAVASAWKASLLTPQLASFLNLILNTISYEKPSLTTAVSFCHSTLLTFHHTYHDLQLSYLFMCLLIASPHMRAEFCLPCHWHNTVCAYVFLVHKAQ